MTLPLAINYRQLLKSLRVPVSHSTPRLRKEIDYLEIVQSLADPITAQEPKKFSRAWQYGKYIKMGAGLLVAGLFAFRLCKETAPKENINTIRQQLK